jgi:hypothetical protein
VERLFSFLIELDDNGIMIVGSSLFDGDKHDIYLPVAEAVRGQIIYPMFMAK